MERKFANMTGLQFRQARASLGLTQQQLSEILDVSRRSVIRWEISGPPIAVALAMKYLARQLAT